MKEKGRAYPVLKIKGETTIKKINFKNTVDLSIILKLNSEIEDVQYEVKNGLTLVYIRTVLPKEDLPTIEAKLVDEDSDDSALDW